MVKQELEEIEESTISPNPYKIIVVVAVLLLFSLLSPILFTQFSSFIDFSNSEYIGDSIGIMNPFITIISVILTFFAFKIQFDANVKQLEIFNKSVRNSKIAESNKFLDLQIENLDMLIFDLEEYIKDLKQRLELIELYTNYNSLNIFEYRPLSRISFARLKNILQNDRKLVYQYLKIKCSKDDLESLWLKKYSKLYSRIGSIPEYFEDIYGRSDRFSEKIELYFQYFQSESTSIYQSISILHRNIERVDELVDIAKMLNIFLNSYKSIVEKPLEEKSNNDIITISNLFVGLHEELTRWYYKTDIDLSGLLIGINNLIVETNRNSNGIVMFKDRLRSDVNNTFYSTDSPVDELEQIKEWLLKLK